MLRRKTFPHAAEALLRVKLRKDAACGRCLRRILAEGSYRVAYPHSISPPDLGGELWFVVLFVALHALPHYFEGLFGRKKFPDRARVRRTRPFQSLVILEIILGLRFKMFSELVERSNVVHTLIVDQDADDLVIYLAFVGEFHSSYHAHFCDTTGNERLRHVDEQNVERVTVEIEGMGDRAVGEWIGERRVSDAVKLQLAGFVDELVFINGTGRDFNDDVHAPLRFIGKRRKDMQEVVHVPRRFLINVRHIREVYPTNGSMQLPIQIP